MSDGTLSRPTTGTLIDAIRLQTQALQSGLDVNGVMLLVALQAQRLTGAAGAAVKIVEGDEMVYRAAVGMIESQTGVRLPYERSLSGLCMSEQRLFICHDSETDTRVDRRVCRRIGLRSMVLAPLSHLGKRFGVLKVVSPQVAAFDDTQLETLGLISNLFAATLFNAPPGEPSSSGRLACDPGLFRQLSRTFDEA